jgi:cytochrome b6-f complex iron-sulfur subunit
MEPIDMPQAALSRRRLLAGAGAGAAALAVAACGNDDGASSSGGSTGTKPKNTPTAGGGASGSEESLTALADVPVGGAVSAEDSSGKPVIVSRPAKGKVVAFSAICTHMGCTVAPEGDQLACPCHGSTFDPATGDNTGGPAPKPLARISVRVEGGQVVET